MRRRADLRTQRDALVAALGRSLPQWHVPVPRGGLSLWCHLPEGTSSSLLADAAEPLGLRIATGSRFGTGHAFDDRLRLPYVHEPDVLDAAVTRLAAAYAEVVDGAPVRAAAGSALDLVV